MRKILSSILLRLGVAGKLILHVGWILAVSLGLLVYLAHARARGAIRDELRATQSVRIQQWSARHDAEIRSGDAWKLAEAISELGRDPYVVFAGLYDRSGRVIAHSGDESAYEGAHALDLVVGLRSAAEGSPEGARPAEGRPLPGLAPVPQRVERTVPFREGFREVLEDSGRRSEDLLGWVEVTLTTAPLDRVASGALRPLLVLGSLLFAAGIVLTWLLARSFALPLRLMRQNVDLISAGGLDVPFDEVPRPADEIGDLATRLSIMAGRIRKDQNAAQGGLPSPRAERPRGEGG